MKNNQKTLFRKVLLIFGFAVISTQLCAEVTITPAEEAVVGLVGTGIATLASKMAGASSDFVKSLVTTGVLWSTRDIVEVVLPEVPRSTLFKIQFVTMEMPLLVALNDSIKHLREYCPEKVLEQFGGVVSGFITREGSIALYGILKTIILTKMKQ